MSPNPYLPHVVVLPEDDADSDVANGFWLQVEWNRQRQMQVLPVAGGWEKVLDRFKSDHVKKMERYPARFMVLLIDFDDKKDRLDHAKRAIPPHLADRVFVLGALSEPEALKPDLGVYEKIGSDMAKDCREGTDKIWRHPFLRHNASELDRLRGHIRPMLFPSNG